MLGQFGGREFKNRGSGVMASTFPPESIKTLSNEEDQLRKQTFDDVCRRLNVDEETKTNGWKLISVVPEESNAIDQYTSLWIPCALYTATQTGENRTSGLPLSIILKEVQTRLVDFFAAFRTFSSWTGTNLETFHVLEKKYVVDHLLFRKYEDLYGAILLPSTEPIFLFGWTVFLVAKAKFLPEPDLISGLHLLACVVNLIFVHAPNHLRKVSIKEPEFTSSNTLEYTCNLGTKLDYEQVSTVNETLLLPYIKMLKTHNLIKYNPAKVPSESVLAKSFYLGGLLEGTHLQANCNMINGDYDFLYLTSGDFDERLFINQPDLIGSPSKLPVNTKNYYHINNSFAAKSPISTALASSTWFHKVISVLGDEPGPQLKRILMLPENDFLADMTHRIATLTCRLPPEYADYTQKGVRFYFRMLEIILLTEERRLGHSHFPDLLKNDLFHKNLLAVSIEITFFIFKVTQFEFPKVLHLFDIQSYHFLSIIENVIRHEPEIPKVVIRHLTGVEERILESLAWEHHSPLLTIIRDEDNQSALISQGNNSTLNSSVKAPALLMSPVKATPTVPHFLMSPVKGTSKKMSSTLSLFYRKLFQLASLRGQDMCKRLQIQSKIWHQVWHTLVSGLVQHTALMENHHLDQMIVCAIYGVSRANGFTITFRDIIDHYKKYRQHGQTGIPPVFRDIPIKEDKGDIIQFYNAMFIPEMEQALLQARTVPIPKSPSGKENESIMSPDRPAVYLSSMRGSTTPNTKLFVYSMGNSPSKNLKSINETINSPIHRPSKRQLFKDADVDVPAPSPKSKQKLFQ